jgi:hypothetical protein
MASSGILSGAGAVKLFRAVGGHELADILRRGGFYPGRLPTRGSGLRNRQPMQQNGAGACIRQEAIHFTLQASSFGSTTWTASVRLDSLMCRS